MSPYILLGFFIAGLLHAFCNPSMMSRQLSGRGFGPIVKAALFGIPLPLCSCGVLPTAVSLRRAGASKGATASFLIATPQTGVDSIAATWSLLGLPFAVIRPVAALVGSVFGGALVGASDKGAGAEVKMDQSDNRKPTFFGRLADAIRYGMVDMVASVGKWLVIGLVIAACITVFVPDEIFLGLKEYPILAMLLMVVVAVPMYICATGSIPIALSLMLKGLTPGVGFVLLMAGPAANFASVMVLRKELGSRGTAMYVASVVITAIAFGLLIDYLLPASWFLPDASILAPGGHHGLGIFDTICSVVLVGLLINAYIQHRRGNVHSHHHAHGDAPEMEIKVEGMMCPHCQAAVRDGLSELDGVDAVEVDLGKGLAYVHGHVARESVVAKIEALGYDVK
ncbi:MAG: permease [Clostridium sp.]|nr:permease [Clostridium sp.]